MNQQSSGWLELAVVQGAHGVRGALKIRLFSAHETTLKQGVTIRLVPPDGGEVIESAVERLAFSPGQEIARVWLAGIEDRTAAEALRGCRLELQRENLPQLSDDEFYLADIVGASVFLDGREPPFTLGTITGLASNGVQDLLEICWVDRKGSKHDWYLPVHASYFVEVAPNKLIVRPPEGFLPDELERLAGREGALEARSQES